ncbi:hypothetical protein DFH11DRAFT_284290 [Phellopilus nigrolimitatus]|nr:hypothetical protein DFH11DRAFT_284290 [Phellopilus nigrolimitatus]
MVFGTSKCYELRQHVPEKLTAASPHARVRPVPILMPRLHYEARLSPGEKRKARNISCLVPSLVALSLVASKLEGAETRIVPVLFIHLPYLPAMHAIPLRVDAPYSCHLCPSKRYRHEPLWITSKMWNSTRVESQPTASERLDKDDSHFFAMKPEIVNKSSESVSSDDTRDKTSRNSSDKSDDERSPSDSPAEVPEAIPPFKWTPRGRPSLPTITKPPPPPPGKPTS